MLCRARLETQVEMRVCRRLLASRSACDIQTSNCKLSRFERKKSIRSPSLSSLWKLTHDCFVPGASLCCGDKLKCLVIGASRVDLSSSRRHASMEAAVICRTHKQRRDIRVQRDFETGQNVAVSTSARKFNKKPTSTEKQTDILYSYTVFPVPSGRSLCVWSKTPNKRQTSLHRHTKYTKQKTKLLTPRQERTVSLSLSCQTDRCSRDTAV